MDKKVLFFSSICLLFGIFLLINTGSFKLPDKNSRKLYKQGLEFIQKNDLQNAYYNFGKIKPYSDLYSLSVFRQALVSDDLKDNKTSIKKFKKFLKLVPNDENFTPCAMWHLAEAYKRENKNHQAKTLYKKIIKNYKETDFSAASEYRLAELASDKNEEIKKKYYIKYLEDAPIGRFSILAIDSLKKYPLSQLDKIIIADSYYQKADYTNALSMLDNVNVPNAYFLKGKIYLSKKEYEKSKEAFLSYLKYADKEDGEKINEAIGAVVKNSRNPSLTYQTLIKINNSNTILGIDFNYAQNLNNKESLRLYEKIYKTNEKSFFAPESLSELFWSAYKKRNYNLAIKYSDTHTQTYKNVNSSPKILYFSGKIQQNLRHKKMANKYFNKIVQEYPDSYYAYRANEKLNNTIEQFSVPYIGQPNYSNCIKFKTNSKLLNMLIKLDDIEAINMLKLKNEFVKSFIASKKGNSSYSIVLARDELSRMYPKPDKNSPNWCLAYPVYYEDVIKHASKAFNYNPYLILAIVKEESFFDNNARSKVGAVGLMQLMPSTADFVNKRKVSLKELEDEDFNVYTGVRYIASLRHEFGNEMLAVAAYNGGIGNVQKWKNSFFNGDYDDFVEEIPFLETKTYVKKVFASFANYRRIY